MANKLFIIGIGPGNEEYIYPAARKYIESGDILVGGKRNLELFHSLQKEEVVIGSSLEPIVRFIRDNIDTKRIVVLASGDPGIFSIAEYVKKHLCGVEMEVYPGISSLQYLCARVGKRWEDIFIVSLHGRECKDVNTILHTHGKVAIFTGGSSSPDGICRELARHGFGNAAVIVGENLSYPDERIVTGFPEDIAKMEFGSLSLMLVENPAAKKAQSPAWEYETSGIPDEMFIRGEVPMTKEEVRSVTLSKLRLREDSVVYDVGAGTGSVSIECALRMKHGRVYAIEKEQNALELIRANILKFGLNNITLVEGVAPYILHRLPEPDRIFIGGTGGSMEDILDWIFHLSGDVRIVINAVAIESAYEALAGLQKQGCKEVEITCVSVARGRTAGKKHLMQALNPVYIISGEKSSDYIV